MHANCAYCWLSQRFVCYLEIPVWFHNFNKFLAEVKQTELVETPNKIVCLQDSLWLGRRNFGNELYIRRSYIAIAQEIVQIYDSNEFRNGVALIGTPGIGKSQFLAYLFWYIYYKKTAIKTIIICHVCVNHMIIVNRESNTIDIDSLDNLVLFDDEKETICLYEGRKQDMTPVPSELSFFLIAACSPSVKYEAFVTQGDMKSALELYMPLWTWYELQNASRKSKYFCDEVVLKKLCEHVGGMVNYTLKVLQIPNMAKNADPNHPELRQQTDELYDTFLRKFKAKIDCHDITENGWIKAVTLTEVRSNAHHILEQFIVSEDFRSYRAEIASKFVQNELLKRANDEMVLKHFDFILNQHSPDAIRRGKLFEYYAHILFKSSPSLPTFNCDRKKEFMRPFTCLQDQVEFHGQFTRDNADIDFDKHFLYCKPLDPNFPAVDAIRLPSMLLQMTISKEHDLKPRPLKALVKMITLLRTQYPEERLKLLYVVPISTYRIFVPPANVPEGVIVRTVGIDLNDENIRQAILKYRC